MRIQITFVILLFLSLCNYSSLYTANTSCAHASDLIVFSFDRPLQLYCLLESLEAYVHNLGTITVLGRASNSSFKEAYDQVHERFTDVNFVWQGNEPKKDFKPLLMRCLDAIPSSYIMFATDDIVVTDYIDVCACTHMLEQYQAYGFYVRLGLNIIEHYQQNNAQLTLPTLTNMDDDLLQFAFNEGSGPWAYPHSVDMVIFRKKDVQRAFATMQFSSPNILESRWQHVADRTVKGLCFAHSKIVNLPMNLVQQDYENNRYENSFSPKELLEFWHQGLKIDITKLFHLNNHACHIPYIPTFIARNP
jgi:hypothetical protein